VRIRHVPVPVSLVDFASQYSNVARLSRVWSFLTSERIVAVDATDEVREMLEGVELGDVLCPELWPQLVGVALVRPDGDILPTRAWFCQPRRRAARRARRGDPVLGSDPVRLIAPAGSDPGSAPWAEVATGLPIPDDEVTIATHGEELVRLVLHPELKMLGPDGLPCRYTTKGLLRPRRVKVAAIHIVGKEGNRIEEVATGEVLELEQVLVDYGDDEWESVILPAARVFGVRRLARETGLARSKLAAVLRGYASPRLRTRVGVSQIVRPR